MEKKSVQVDPRSSNPCCSRVNSNYLLLCKNYYKLSSLKQHGYIILKLQMSGHRWAGSSAQTLTRLPSRCQLDCVFSGAPGPLPSSCDCRHNSVLCICRTEGSILLLAVGKGLSQLPRGCVQFFATWQFHRSSQKTLAYFFKSSRINSCSSLLRWSLI